MLLLLNPPTMVMRHLFSGFFEISEQYGKIFSKKLKFILRQFIVYLIQISGGGWRKPSGPFGPFLCPGLFYCLKKFLAVNFPALLVVLPLQNLNNRLAEWRKSFFQE